MALDFTINADTKEAESALKTFFSGSKEGLKQMRETGMAARESFRALGETVAMVGGEKVQELIAGVMTAREAFMSLRSVAALTGKSIAEVAPILGGLGLAIATGIGLWRAYQEELGATADRARRTAEEVKNVGKFLEQLNALRSGGSISPGQKNFFTGLLTGDITAAGGTRPDQEWLMQQLRKNPEAFEVLAGDTFSRTGLAALQKRLVATGDLVPDESGKNFELSPGAAAAQNIQALRRMLGGTWDSEEEKKMTEVSKRFEDLTEKAKLWGAAALQSGKISREAVEALIKQLEVAEQHELRDVEIEKERQMAQQAGEAFDRRQEELRKIAADETAELERRLTHEALLAGQERGQDYEHEFLMRKTLLQSQLFEGVVTEKEYTIALQEEENKRLEAARRAAQEEIQLSKMARENDVARLRLVEEMVRQNPYISEQERAAQLLPVLRAITAEQEKQLADVNKQLSNPALDPRQRAGLMMQQTQLGGQVAVGNQQIGVLERGSLSDNWARDLAKLKSQWGEVAKTLSQGAFKEITSGIHGMAEALTKVILGAKGAGQAFLELGQQMLASFISTVLEAVMMAYIAIPVLTALGVLSGGATVAQGGVVTTSILASTLGSVGGMVGRESGGPVDAGQPYIVGEAGKEIFMPSVPGVVLPNSFVQSLSSSGVGGDTHVHLAILHKDDEIPAWAKTTDGKGHIVDVVRQNIHKINSRP